MTEFDTVFARAQALQADGRIDEAAEAYQELAKQGEHREAALSALADLYLQARRPSDAGNVLLALVEEMPDSLHYYARLATLLDEGGKTGVAISVYQRLLGRRPELATAHYNLALLLKKQKRYAEAMAAYENAVRLGIDRVQEVYTNMGVLCAELHRADQARELFERALDVDPRHIPAMFNLASLFEEAGEREQATALYHKILSIEPRHWDSLARLAYATRLTSREDPLIGSLRDATNSKVDDRLAHEGLYFALGKVLDDVGLYDAAFAAYKSGNELGKERNPPYDRIAAERTFDELIGWCDANWIRNAATSSADAPIFICGMFRSGSTLAEQILAAHPSITAGGELDILPWLLTRRLAPYPQRLQSASQEELQQLADDYVSRRGDLFPEAKHVTDKRPDNYVHLGLIKALFPAARIVYTQRDPLDNCLSVYFQQLGGNLAYATNLENIAHYYKQHERLMEHWRACLGENIFTLSYDDLVRSPEAVLRGLLDFLGLDWDDRCLEFQHTDSLVKTASVWQVREELHPRSSGRWRNYEAGLQNIRAQF